MKAIFLVFFISFSSFCSAHFFKKECPLGTVYNSYTKELKASGNFHVIGTGAGMPMGKLNKIFMSFQCVQEVSLSEGRKLYIKTSQGLLDNVNANLLIRPWMEYYPFTWKNIDLDLSFIDKKGNVFLSGKIAIISRINEKLCFAIKDEKTHRFNTIHTESFEDSLKIVKGELPDPYIEPIKE